MPASTEATAPEADSATSSPKRSAAPELTVAHIDLGIGHAQAGDLDAAEKSLRTAVSLNPKHPMAHNELGIVLRKQGKFKKARDSYEKALSIYPDFHFARRNLAILCDVYLLDSGCAIKHYEIYGELVPEDEAEMRNIVHAFYTRPPMSVVWEMDEYLRSILDPAFVDWVNRTLADTPSPPAD